jgi:hypothetical protein
VVVALLRVAVTVVVDGITDRHLQADESWALEVYGEKNGGLGIGGLTARFPFAGVPGVTQAVIEIVSLTELLSLCKFLNVR